MLHEECVTDARDAADLRVTQDLLSVVRARSHEGRLALRDVHSSDMSRIHCLE
jgi:hypothetical protein